MKKTVLQQLSSHISARLNCQRNGNTEWYDKHSNSIDQILRDFFPKGSGFDNGCEIDLETSNEKRIDVKTSFHHMNDNGFYDGWTDHVVRITPAFHGFDIRVSGKDQRNIKEYITSCFDITLSEIIQFDGEKYVSAYYC